jgi:cyclic pyranopterin phosphate synthase
MCKALDKGMEITDIYLVEKTGGKSGDFRRAPGARKMLPRKSPRSAKR